MRLGGKVALVTGGASGIGRAIARRYRQEGARLYLADRDAEAGRVAADAIDASFIRLDVTDPDGWTNAIARIEAEAGMLDALCNNAGIVGNQAIDATDIETWNRVVAVNVTGAMLGCRAAIALMRQRSAGTASIINVASTTSFLGLAFDAAYTTSKHAVLGLTRSVAAWCAEQRLPIRCNTLHPGTTRTPILEGQIAERPDLEQVFSGMSPMGRMAEPAEIAGVALFLASDESSYCTGGAFVADGGLTATHPTM